MKAFIHLFQSINTGASSRLKLMGLLIGLLAFGAAQSQQCDEVTLNEARKAYELGRFGQVINNLERCSKNRFSEKQKIEAHRLCAMAWLAQDSIQSAIHETALLLQINPAYEPNLFDQPAFIRMVNRLKTADVGQIVTSVSKKAENIFEAPASIMVVTREDILRRGYNDLVELLKDVPGFDLTLFYGPEYANIYQRGFRQNNTEKTLLLFDGMEENDLWTNWAYIDRQYPLSNIERVEIIYGPASTMYGPNAFAGVINVISRNSTDAIRPGRNIGVSGKMNYGSYNTRTLDLSVSGKKRNISFTLSGRLYHSDEHDLSGQKYFDYDASVYDQVDYNALLGIGSDALTYLTSNNLPLSHPFYQLSADSTKLNLTTLGEETARDLDKSAYEQIVGGKKIGFSNNTDSWLLNGKVSVGNFSFGFQTWKYFRGGTTQYTDLYVAGSENGFNWVPQLSNFYTKYETHLGENLYLSNLTTFRIHEVTDDTRFVSLSNYARGNKKLAALVREEAPVWNSLYMFERSKQLRNELKINYRPSSRLDVVTGLEVRNSSLQGAYYTSFTDTPQDSAVILPSPKGGNEFNVWDLGIYSQGTWLLYKTLRMTLGLRYDYNKVRKSDGFGSEFSPRAALVWSPGRSTFKAIYSRGIMNVSNWTKYSSAGNRIPNPSLKTENIQNIEFSAAWRFSSKLQADLAFYQNYIDNVVGTVDVPDNPGKIQNANIGKFDIRGIQANATYKQGTFSSWINYTYSHPRQTYSEAGEVDNRVGDIAAHQFNAGVNKLFFNQLNVNLRLNYSGERPVGEGTTVPLNNDHFPAVTILNSAVNYSNPELLKGFALQLVCNNIFNTVYYHPGTKAAEGINSPTAILQRGRHFLVSLSYDF